MGCSPSHALIINSPSAQETICLQPRIFMVSESTLCLLQDVGELRVYRVDDRNPETALEKFRGAQDQLQNPLLFHPHLRQSRAVSQPSSLPQGSRQARMPNGVEAYGSAPETEGNDQIRKESIQAAKNCDDIDDVDGCEAGEEIQAKVIKSTSNTESREHPSTTEV